MCHTYSRLTLVTLMTAVTGCTLLKPPCILTLHNLNLYKRTSTRRSHRAGKKFAYYIHGKTTVPLTGPNMNNLVYPTVSHTEKGQTPSSTKLLVLNAQSVNNKALAICEYTKETNADLVAITESWIKAGNTAVKKEMCPSGYKFEGNSRKSRTGGGVGLIHRESFVVQPNVDITDTYPSFEYQCLSIRAETLMQLVIIYRPTRSRKNTCTMDDFLQDLEVFLGELTILPGSLIVVGDFNIHVNKPDEKHVKLFNNMLNTMHLHQHINEPTHKSGNTLDLIISRTNEELLAGTKVLPRRLSDHHAIITCLSMSPPKPKPHVVTYRKLRKIDLTSFSSDVREEFATIAETQDTIDADSYNKILGEVLDKHAPEITRRIVPHTSKPWYSDEIHQERRQRRRYERKWLKTKLEVHRQIYISQCQNVVECIKQAKLKYYKEKLSSASSKEAFKCIHDLKDQDEKCLPSHQEANELANRFAKFFHDKVAAIRSTLDSKTVSPQAVATQPNTVCPIFHLNTICMEELSKILRAAPTKSCSLDPIPTWLLKEQLVMTNVKDHILTIINRSIVNGEVPPCWKTAVVTPLIKKPGLDAELLKN
jgi:exonuclease III